LPRSFVPFVDIAGGCLQKVPDTMRFSKRMIGLIPVFVFLGFAGPGTDRCSALTAEEKNTISVYERVAPSVVNISTEVCDLDFFQCAVPGAGTGSGIVLKEDGLILTSYHVVAQARDIQVTLSDDRHLKARIVGTNPEEDLALLKVDVGQRPLTPIVNGDSRQLRVGEKVLAVGNPFGLGQTLTTGTVSMVGRDVRSGRLILRDLIQTDASINPGSSGGVLVNSRGEMVGMNTAILSPTGMSAGIGFAVPTHQIDKELSAMRYPWPPWARWILPALFGYWVFRRITRLGRREQHDL